MFLFFCTTYVHGLRARQNLFARPQKHSGRATLLKKRKKSQLQDKTTRYLDSRGVALHEGKLPLVLDVQGDSPYKGEPAKHDEQPNEPSHALLRGVLLPSLRAPSRVRAVLPSLVVALRGVRRPQVEGQLDEAEPKPGCRPALARNGSAENVREQEAQPVEEERHKERRAERQVVAKSELVACGVEEEGKRAVRGSANERLAERKQTAARVRNHACARRGNGARG